MPVNSDVGLTGRDFLSISSLSGAELVAILDSAEMLKKALKQGMPHPLLSGRTLAMIFEKPSLRTRATFETGITQLGGHAIDLAHEHLQIGVRESIEDIGRNLARWVDIIMARVFKHETLIQLASAADIPIINGLSDQSHPCQILADLLTLREHRGHLEGLKLAYVGDGFNIANSLITAAPHVGISITLACPNGFEPRLQAIKEAAAVANTSTEIKVVADPEEAVRGADAVYTDSWISMGQEDEIETRLKAFAGYQVDTNLMRSARPDAIFMHCLPAHRGQEVSNAVIDSSQSVVFDQAENRLHTQKALLVHLLRGPNAFKDLF